MSEVEKYFKLAKDSGLTHFVSLDVSTLEFLPEIRDMCNPKQCRRYNTSWSCPPACPSLEQLRDKAAVFSVGIIVQTVGDIEDSLD